MTFQKQHSFIKALIWIALLCKYQLALSNSCQVYPSEYAYLDSSVVKSERVSANCRRYPAMFHAASIHSEDYTHCDGTQLRLTDSDLGSEQYSSSDYYMWGARSSESQLLFIFPTGVNLTTITLHYYSDNVRGLPRLRFYAVADDFDVWDAPSISYGFQDITPVLPGGEPTGNRSVSIIFNYTTPKVLMHKSRSDFMFAVSEVKFFCNGPEMTTISTIIQPSQPTTTASTSSASKKSTTSNPPQHQHTTDNAYTSKDSPSPKQFTDSQSDSDLSQQQSENNLYSLLAGVTVTALIVVVGISVLVVLLLLWRKKRIQKNKMNCNLERQDGLYSTLDRGTKQQTQPHSWDASTELYDQIQLSPSTGQSEPIQSETENDKINIVVSSTQLDCHNMEKTHKIEPEKTNTEFATYAVVDKRKKTKSGSNKEETSESHDSTSEKGVTLDNKASIEAAVTVESDKLDNIKYQQSEKNENLEEMYAVVQKKPKKCEEEIAPPVPSHTTESLYTAVQKKLKQDMSTN